MIGPGFLTQVPTFPRLLNQFRGSQPAGSCCYSKVLLLLDSNGSFRKLGGPYLGVLVIRILLFRVLYWGPLFSETHKYLRSLTRNLHSVEGSGTVNASSNAPNTRKSLLRATPEIVRKHLFRAFPYMPTSGCFRTFYKSIDSASI